MKHYRKKISLKEQIDEALTELGSEPSNSTEIAAESDDSRSIGPADILRSTVIAGTLSV